MHDVVELLQNGGAVLFEEPESFLQLFLDLVESGHFLAHFSVKGVKSLSGYFKVLAEILLP